MTVPFMDAYVQLLIKTCHKRGVHAMVRRAGPPMTEREADNRTGRNGSPNSDQR